MPSPYIDACTIASRRPRSARFVKYETVIGIIGKTHGVSSDSAPMSAASMTNAANVFARVAAAKELAKITGANAPQQVELSAKAGVMVVAGVAPTPEQWAASHAGQPASSTPAPSNGKSNGHSNGAGKS